MAECAPRASYLAEAKSLDFPITLVQRATSTLRRVVIERVDPEIDGGRYPIKRTIGEKVRVAADIFADGHDRLGAMLLYRFAEEETWREAEMSLLTNDRWQGEFPTDRLGRYFYTLIAWVDAFRTWSTDFAKRVEAGQGISLDVLTGADILRAAGERADGSDSRTLASAASELKNLCTNPESALKLATSPQLSALAARYRERESDVRYETELAVVVDPEKARFSAWYELFPRSCTKDVNRHGTFRDVIDRLAYVAGMGFDVLYLAPIHPIGLTERKGKNNSLNSSGLDPGSPWAIGSEEGGHKAIHPQLGSLEDFKELQRKARQFGMDLALDLAYQTSPDHPYLKERREWFRERPDGTIQYAENPPKKYQDIYPFDFETEHAAELWEELKSIVVYWIEQGVRIFRVDNPHTKPFAFWEWLINGIKQEYPDVIFLSEAFTRPKVMYQLAKLGFTQSYTYFAWKNTSHDLREYFAEITQPPIREYFRANIWPNTPDILNEYLQRGGRPAFAGRLILAATLGANYGIYGPAFELCENRPIREGSEEYLNSEKYEIRVWNIDDPNSLKDLITHLNGIRRAHPALQSDANLRFHPVDNDQLIAYSKVSDDRSDMIFVVVNVDPRNRQSGWVNVITEELRLGSQQSYQVHDLLTDARYIWHGSRNFVQLDPTVLPAHIFQVHAIA
jgi:starch synthase (maltosyl-transferring)